MTLGIGRLNSATQNLQTNDDGCDDDDDDDDFFVLDHRRRMTIGP